MMMHDLLGSQSEVVVPDGADVFSDQDSSGPATIRRGKADQEGAGVELYLAPVPIDHFGASLETARITEGAIFRPISKSGTIGDRLPGAKGARTVKRLGDWADLPPDVIDRISDHSFCIGNKEDLVAVGADVAGVMRAGRRKRRLMPSRYSGRLPVAQRRNGAIDERAGDF